MTELMEEFVEMEPARRVKLLSRPCNQSGISVAGGTGALRVPLVEFPLQPEPWLLPNQANPLNRRSSFGFISGSR